MTTQQMDTLRDRVAEAIHADQWGLDWLDSDYYIHERCRTMADAALAALGLTDLDAAVERAVPGVQRIMGDEWTANDCGASANLIYGVLEDALTP